MNVLNRLGQAVRARRDERQRQAVSLREVAATLAERNRLGSRGEPQHLRQRVPA